VSGPSGIFKTSSASTVVSLDAAATDRTVTRRTLASGPVIEMTSSCGSPRRWSIGRRSPAREIRRRTRRGPSTLSPATRLAMPAVNRGSRPTVTGYADRFSVAPGEPIEFKISCADPGEFDAVVVRLRNGDTNPAGPGWFWFHPNAQPTCAPTTPSTPNPTDLTRCCWPGCRCFIPTGCTRSRAWDREMRCGGRPSCTPPWPTVHSSPGTGSRGFGSDRINSDACPAATRRALRAWARSTSVPLCAPTIPNHAEPDRRREVSRARFWQPRAPAVGLADKKYGPKRRPSCRPGR
jgi:hypothetical protein